MKLLPFKSLLPEKFKDATLSNGTATTAVTIAVVKSVKQDANTPIPWVEPQPVPDPQPAPIPMDAWVMDSIGWWYRNADGSYPTNISMVVDGHAYHFDERGYMRTSWVSVGGMWYYLHSSGVWVI